MGKRISKVLRTRAVISCFICFLFLLSSCSPANEAVVENSVTATFTPTGTITNSPTITEVAPTITPTIASPESLLFEGITFDYNPIPYGEEHVTVIDGRKVAIQVSKVITGTDADQIAFTNAPEELQWLVIQLRIKYLEGDTNERVELLDAYDFNLVSKGNPEVGEPWLSYTPSPKIRDVKLVPGEESLAYLTFMAYSDDPTPLLRYSDNEEEVFFALTYETVQLITPENDFLLASSLGIGTFDQPIPKGETAYIEYGNTVYKINIERVLQGYKAYVKVKDYLGINDDPPDGYEYIVPYVTVEVAKTMEQKNTFNLNLFSSYSKNENIDQPENFLCSLPCFVTSSLYPNGTISGWVPLLMQIDDPDPLLVFNDEVAFQLVNEEDKVLAVSRQINSNTIGYANKDEVKLSKVFQQSGPVYAIAFSLDNKYLITAGDDKLVHVWDIDSEAELVAVKGHDGSIRDITFSWDGAYLASMSNIGEVFIWDTEEWTSSLQLDLAGNGVSVRFLPDGTLVTVNILGKIDKWDIETGKSIIQENVPRTMSTTCSGASVQSFDMSDDGSIYAASLSCGYSAIWEAGTSQIIFGSNNQQEAYQYRYKTSVNTSTIALSPDGSTAAYGMSYYPSRRLMLLDLIDVKNKKIIASVNPIDRDVNTVKIAPNNDLVISGVGNLLYMWWPEAYVWGGDNLLSLSGHSGAIVSLQYSLNGEMLASGDYSGKTILWDTK